MNAPIQIHDHGFRHLEIGSSAKPLALGEESLISHEFSHQVMINDEAPNYFKVSFSCHLWQTQKDEQAGAWVKAELYGIFSVPADLPEEKRPAVVVYNGLSILYGLLRGVISTLTASFEAGKFTLPALLPASLATVTAPAE